MALIVPRLRDLMSEGVIILVRIHYTAVDYTLVQQLHKVKVVKQIKCQMNCVRHTIGKGHQTTCLVKQLVKVVIISGS